MIRKLALSVGALLLIYGLYLGWRVATERNRTSARVDTTIAAADPAERALPADRINILLAIEDPTFATNRGIDFSTPGAGLTTVSQSLGKRIFFEHFRPGFPKGELIVLTRFALYPNVDKRRTLTAFIATAQFGSFKGRPVIGFGDASRTWVGKPLDRLTDGDYLTLVAMLPAPTTYNPVRHPAANAERVARIERLLARRCGPDGLRDVHLKGCAPR
ncbi:MAG: transglycosylase domain-containing protein [Sphingomonas bacterium]|nr:transglycosylase domain-containing protein [Sphingomonas bacterium]